MAFRIFPADERVIELLVQMSQCAAVSVDLLAEHIGSTGDRVQETMQALLETEDECNNLYFSVMTTTRSSYVVPIPRQDLYILAQWLLKAVQSLVATAETQRMYDVDRPSAYASEQLGVIRLMTELTVQAMRRLGTLDDLDDYWFEMLRLGRQSERTHRAYRAELLDKHKAAQAMRRIDIAECMANAARAMTNLSAEVGRVLVSES